MITAGGKVWLDLSMSSSFDSGRHMWPASSFCCTFSSFLVFHFSVCGLFSTVLQRVCGHRVTLLAVSQSVSIYSTSTIVAPFLNFQPQSEQLNVVASYKHTKMDEEKQEKKEKSLHEYAT
jgi:hypothetical protein